jgi:hypothetical protein
MNNYLLATKNFIMTHRKKVIIASAGTVLAIAVLTTAVLLFIYNMPKTAYQPVKACDMFTSAKAQDLLGDKVISVDTKAPVVSGDTAVSKCSYTDSNPVKDKMMVAAIAVRTGINEDGLKQNKTEFAASKSNNKTEVVENLGDSAYFNKVTGQLNILKDHEWIILSYGVGSTPQDNSLDKAKELAKKILN